MQTAQLQQDKEKSELRQQLQEQKEEIQRLKPKQQVVLTTDKTSIALLNMLEDMQEEKKKIERERMATLNILEDINEAREELNRSYKKLRGMDAMKDEFTNLGAHELKTPLVPLKGYLEILQKTPEKFGLNEAGLKHIETCQRNVERLRELVGDILEISKLQTGQLKFEMKDLDFVTLLKDVVGGYRELITPNGVEFKAEIPESLPKIYGDATRLTEVVSNLLENAKKFTEKGCVVLKAAKSGDVIRVDVIDTGMGIKKEDHERLFTKFFQGQGIVKRKTKGTGLGLAISKKIIEAHGGKIWGESKGLGKGSTFSFALPINGKHKVPVKNHVKEAKKAGEKAKTILGIDGGCVSCVKNNQKEKKKISPKEEEDNTHLQKALKFQKEVKELKEKLAKEKK